ncbi:Tetratricopeptide repeat-containing protein [Roseivivax lentus]|uniref:Tetratricopeptide repeat-containing protein n=1 Tax=Roseivivax lentus TaxID=633194 RepID=A0A1N7NNS5_9RHOB|nr:tetratricopeptide repeat protein [Roseivivax lentus]SIS99868.1 Tetratricopeptide repeat-containing protein [Roseivivax lentus]
MSRKPSEFNSTVAAFAALVAFSLPAPVFAEAGGARADTLTRELAEAVDPAEAQRLERELRLEWSKSGSAAMDLLLKRGRDALEINETERAVDHLLALTDHAPDFAEGWYTLGQAYYAQERLGLAADALERTLTLNPNHFGALQGMGALLEQLGRRALAYRAYAEAEALRPFDENVTEALKRLDIAANGTRL